MLHKVRNWVKSISHFFGNHFWAFFREESETYVQTGTLNGLFVLGRSIGFIGKNMIIVFSQKQYCSATTFFRS